MILATPIHYWAINSLGSPASKQSSRPKTANNARSGAPTRWEEAKMANPVLRPFYHQPQQLHVQICRPPPTHPFHQRGTYLQSTLLQTAPYRKKIWWRVHSSLVVKGLTLNSQIIKLQLAKITTWGCTCPKHMYLFSFQLLYAVCRSKLL